MEADDLLCSLNAWSQTPLIGRTHLRSHPFDLATSWSLRRAEECAFDGRSLDYPGCETCASDAIKKSNY